MRIGEFSERSGLSIHTIRYYEKIGLLPNVARDASGRRIYDDDLLRWSDFLSRLKATGMPLKQMEHYARLREMGDGTIQERQDMLIAHRLATQNRADDLAKNMEHLNNKIEQYENMKRK